MTETKSLIFRTTPVELVAQIIKLGDQVMTLEIQPRTLFAVSVDSGEAVEIIGTFNDPAQATEAAQALEQQLGHLDGPQLAWTNPKKEKLQ